MAFCIHYTSHNGALHVLSFLWFIGGPIILAFLVGLVPSFPSIFFIPYLIKNTIRHFFKQKKIIKQKIKALKKELKGVDLEEIERILSKKIKDILSSSNPGINLINTYGLDDPINKIIGDLTNEINSSNIPNKDELKGKLDKISNEYSNKLISIIKSKNLFEPGEIDLLRIEMKERVKEVEKEFLEEKQKTDKINGIKEERKMLAANFGSPAGGVSIPAEVIEGRKEEVPVVGGSSYGGGNNRRLILRR